MNSAMLCFLFLVILVNDTCIFAKLVLVQIQNSFCCHHDVEDANDVSRADISKFITALKYKAKNPKDPQSHGAQMVLEDGGLDQHEPIYKHIYIFIKYVIN